jgi:hypothetical protein
MKGQDGDKTQVKKQSLQQRFGTDRTHLFPTLIKDLNGYKPARTI